MRDLVERLRRAHPDSLTDDEIRALWCEAAAGIERLQRALDSRPAINAALPESYIAWSHGIYAMEFTRARGETQQ